MLTLKTNPRPVLNVGSMLCDRPLDKKLDKYELTKFLNKSSANLIIGPPGSGKSSTLYSWFKSRNMLAGVFHNVYVFSKPSSLASMSDPIFSQLPEDQMFHELTQENLGSVIDRIDEADEYENHAIIMDDMGASLKNKDILVQLKTLMFNRRHMHVSLFYGVQTWKTTHKELRGMFTNLFIFRVCKSEMQSIFDEIIQVARHLTEDIAKLVFDKKFNYLFYNVDSGRLFKNFDEIILPGNSIENEPRATTKKERDRKAKKTC